MYGGEPEEYDVKAEQPADLVIIQMGGNDHRPPNEIPGDKFAEAYIDMIEDIHKVWPHAVVVLMVCLFPSLFLDIITPTFISVSHSIPSHFI